MKVIFLDIDGVLNYESADAKTPGGALGIASRPVKVLSRIVKATGAKIVLISTWMDEWNMNDEDCTADGLYLTKKLRREGLHIMDRVDNPTFRGAAIRSWLDKRPNVTDWIVLDDVEFEGYRASGVLPHLIQTDPKEGLTEDHIDKCVRMLNAE